MTPGDFIIIIIEWNTTPLVKGQSRRENIFHMSTTVLWLPSSMWQCGSRIQGPVAAMRRARDSWRSKPLAPVSQEIIG